MNKICLSMYYEGPPEDWHKIPLLTWRLCKAIDFRIITTIDYSSLWKVYECDNIKIHTDVAIEKKMLECGFIGQESYNILGNIKSKKKFKICGLKPFLHKIYPNSKSYEYYGWIDHDVILSDLDISQDDINFGVFYRRDSGQLTVFRSNYLSNNDLLSINPTIDEYIRTKNKSYLYDEKVFQPHFKNTIVTSKKYFGIFLKRNKLDKSEILYKDGKVIYCGNEYLFVSCMKRIKLSNCVFISESSFLLKLT